MENYSSACSRHWDGSTFLAENGYLQEAAYLAGYTAECALKTLVEQGGLLGRPFNHSLIDLSSDGLELALLLNVKLKRYQTDPISTNISGLAQWSETHRYEPTGFLLDSDFENIIKQSQKTAEVILVGLTLDGVFEGSPK